MPMEPTPPRGPTPSSQIEEKCDHGDPAEPYTHHHQAWAERTGRARKREGDGSRLPARFDCSRYLMSGNVPGEREGSRAPTSPHRPQSVGRGPAPRRMWRRDGVSSLGGRQSIGHLLFLSATCMTACYTVAIRHARIDGLHAVAIAAVVSLLVYLPVYLAFFENGLFNVPLVRSGVSRALSRGTDRNRFSLTIRPRHPPLGRIACCCLHCPRADHGGADGRSRAR